MLPDVKAGSSIRETAHAQKIEEEKKFIHESLI